MSHSIEAKQVAEFVSRAVVTELQKQASPWVDRKGAAAYCHCSVQTIDKARATGDIQTYWRGETPMLKKEDLDKWIESGVPPAAKGFAREAVAA